MAFKEFALNDTHSDQLTTITVYKRRGNRSLRLSVGPNGKIRVTIPTWTPYASGVKFAQSRLAWILEHQQINHGLQPGQAIGKAHHLKFLADANASKPSTRIVASEIIITYPAKLTFNSPAVQKSAVGACIRALRKQADQLLPQRLQSLATKHGFTYKSVSSRQLKSRWGSCDSHHNIVLNIFLMQVPWEQIDYVLLHELVHTRVLHHGPDFWAEMDLVLPNAKAQRKSMRAYQPVLLSIDGI